MVKYKIGEIIESQRKPVKVKSTDWGSADDKSRFEIVLCFLIMLFCV